MIAHSKDFETKLTGWLVKFPEKMRPKLEEILRADHFLHNSENITGRSWIETWNESLRAASPALKLGFDQGEVNLADPMTLTSFEGLVTRNLDGKFATEEISILLNQFSDAMLLETLTPESEPAPEAPPATPQPRFNPESTPVPPAKQEFTAEDIEKIRTARDYIDLRSAIDPRLWRSITFILRAARINDLQGLRNIITVDYDAIPQIIWNKVELLWNKERTTVVSSRSMQSWIELWNSDALFDSDRVNVESVADDSTEVSLLDFRYKLLAINRDVFESNAWNLFISELWKNLPSAPESESWQEKVNKARNYVELEDIVRLEQKDFFAVPNLEEALDHLYVAGTTGFMPASDGSVIKEKIVELWKLEDTIGAKLERRYTTNIAWLELWNSFPPESGVSNIAAPTLTTDMMFADFRRFVPHRSEWIKFMSVLMKKSNVELEALGTGEEADFVLGNREDTPVYGVPSYVPENSPAEEVESEIKQEVKEIAHMTFAPVTLDDLESMRQALRSERYEVSDGNSGKFEGPTILGKIRADFNSLSPR